MKIPSAATFLLLSLTSSISTTNAFRATPSSSGRHNNISKQHQNSNLRKNTLKIEPISKLEVANRLGLKTDPLTGVVSIGSNPNQVYNLHNEHEVICPVTEIHQGVLTTYTELNDDNDSEEDLASTMANNQKLVSQAILSGSLAASIRNRCEDGNSLYYLPSVVTLVESFAEDVEACLFDAIPNMGEMMFNAEGLETNEILMDLSDMNDDAAINAEEDEGTRRHMILFSRNTHFDPTSATSDVYLLPSNKRREGKVWKFSIEYKVATINLRMISSFGMRDSTTPLRPDVWLKDDCSGNFLR